MRSYISSRRRSQGRRQHARHRLPHKLIILHRIRGYRSRRWTHVFSPAAPSERGAGMNATPRPAISSADLFGFDPIRLDPRVATDTHIVPDSRVAALVARPPIPFRSTPRPNATTFLSSSLPPANEGAPPTLARRR